MNQKVNMNQKDKIIIINYWFDSFFFITERRVQWVTPQKVCHNVEIFIMIKFPSNEIFTVPYFRNVGILWRTYLWHLNILCKQYL